MNFSVLVIRVKNSTRSVILEENIKTLLKKKPIIVDAVQPKDLPCRTLPFTHTHGSRDLSCTEMAASLSHFRARVRASLSNNDWSLILEEDAILQMNRADLEEILKQFINKKKSYSIHFFPEQFGVLIPSRKTNLYRVIQVPDYAVAYILNRRSLLRSLRKSREIVCHVADWPPGILKSKWYATKNAKVIHPFDSESNKRSLIKKDRENRHQNLRNSSYEKLNRLSKRNLIYYFARVFSRNYYGNNPIASENLRTIILGRKKS